MIQKILGMIAVALVVSIVFFEPAIASPGGKIASAAFETLWGRIILVVLTIVFLPLITYVVVREKLSERRAREDLRFMAKHSPEFEWLRIQERVKDCFYRVHSGWENENLSDTTDWMTAWYWQNQQMVHLDRWKKEGLKNICDVKKIANITPLLFVHRNQGNAHEGSMIAILIDAKMKDYLVERNSGKVVEGSKRYKNVETVWSFTMEGGQWKVSDIEEGSMSMAYAKLASGLPDIETTLDSDLTAEP